MSRPLTYDEYVRLSLNKRRAQARRAQAHLTALRVAAGSVGPREFYDLDEDDPKSAQTAYETAVLRDSLRRSRRA